MYEAEPARSSSPVRAEAPRPADAPIVEPAPQVEPAIAAETVKLVDDNNDANNNDCDDDDDDAPYEMDHRSNADFCCKCSVSKGAHSKDMLKRLLPCFFDERDFVCYGETVRFVIFKGSTCYVYLDELSNSPLMYTIAMEENFIPTIENRDKPDKHSVTMSPGGNKGVSSTVHETILLKNKKGKFIFQFTLYVEHDKDLTKKFLAAIQNAILLSKSGIKGGICAKVFEEVTENNDVATTYSNEKKF